MKSSLNITLKDMCNMFYVRTLLLWKNVHLIWTPDLEVCLIKICNFHIENFASIEKKYIHQMHFSSRFKDAYKISAT